MQTPSERRAAQRRLAREIKSGTYKPTIVSEKYRLQQSVNKLKKEVFGSSPRYNDRGAAKSTARASMKNLRKAKEYLTDRTDFDWNDIVEEFGEDADSLGYHG